MAVLKMKGKPIVNILRLRQYFDLCDLVWHREEFCDFANGHLRLSNEANYHYSILKLLLSHGVDTGVYTVPGTPEARLKSLDSVNGINYWDNPIGFEKCEVREHLDDRFEQRKAIPVELYKWCLSNLYDQKERQSIFLLLTAGCLLAGVDVPSLMPDPKELISIYGQRNASFYDFQDLALPPVSDPSLSVERVEISFRHCFAAYYGDSLKEGARIRTYWLQNASPHDSILQLDNNKRYTIPADTGLYVNAAEGKIVRVLPNKAENESVRIRRENMGLIVEDGEKKYRIEPAKNTHISSFATGNTSNSLLYIQGYALCMEKYNLPDFLQEKSAFEGKRMVEVAIKEGKYYILQDNGRVYSSDVRWNYRRNVASLAEV